MRVYIYHGGYVEVKGQLVEVSSLFLPCGFQDPNIRLGGKHSYLMSQYLLFTVKRTKAQNYAGDVIQW